MNANLNLTLPKHVVEQLQSITTGTISETVRNILNEFNTADAKNLVGHKEQITPLTIRIDLDLAKKIEDTTKELHIPTTKLVRAIIENYLATRH